MFGIEPPFSTKEFHTKETVNLLNSVTLGSNGARYKHIGIEQKIESLYDPLYLNLSLRNKLTANVTFCRRTDDWYVRYFAFDQRFQSSTQSTRRSSGNSLLNQQLNSFFEKALDDEKGPESFYAYIDPKNERSQWISETFGFTTASTVVTQTFSRLKSTNRGVQKITDKKEIRKLVNDRFAKRPFFHPFQTFNVTPFYILKKKGEIVAFAKSHPAEWKIEQLPGKNGKLMTKILPYIPVLNKIIKPESHKFTVIDSVWIKNNDPKYFQTLAEGILAEENHRVIHWWVDQKEPLWQSMKNKVNWGLLHRISGVNNVNLVVRSKNKVRLNEPAYISGFDFI